MKDKTPNNPLPANDGNVPVMCRATFKGSMPKGQLYHILEYIDGMKQRGYILEKHDRKDNGEWVTIDYVLAKHGT